MVYRIKLKYIIYAALQRHRSLRLLAPSPGLMTLPWGGWDVSPTLTVSNNNNRPLTPCLQSTSMQNSKPSRGPRQQTQKKRQKPENKTLLAAQHHLTPLHASLYRARFVEGLSAECGLGCPIHALVSIHEMSAPHGPYRHPTRYGWARSVDTVPYMRGGHVLLSWYRIIMGEHVLLTRYRILWVGTPC